jgi:hypothetical protein
MLDVKRCRTSCRRTVLTRISFGAYAWARCSSLALMLVTGSLHLTDQGAIAMSYDSAGVRDGDDKISVEPFIELPSVSTELVKIKIRRAYLSISRNYLETAEVTSGAYFATTYARGFFSIVTEFPAFEGAATDTLPCFRSKKWKRCPNMIKIYQIESEESASSRNASIANQVMRSNHVQREDGLIHPVNIDAFESRYYIHREPPSGETVAISCTRPPPIDSLQYCRVYVDFPSGLQIMYQFHTELLPHWREIHNGVRDLFTKFYVNGDK